MTTKNLPSPVAVIVFLIAVTAPFAFGQKTALATGTINPQTVIQLRSCPAGYIHGMTCYKGQVQACPQTVDLGFTYGVKDPVQRSAGTIIFLEGGGGTYGAPEPDYAETYLQHGFQVVYLTWDQDWEYTNGNTGKSIKSAACRPATFLQYVRQHVYTSGGMCAQGASAGAGALGYALAWYGGGSTLDHVELLSGPVFGDIEQGCIVPNPRNLTVCSSGQYGCDGGSWSDDPSYQSPNQRMVGEWSGFQNCNSGAKTAQSANSAWKAMSIVDGTGNGSFSYPQTSMAGWLCSNVDKEHNNSAAQAQYFFQQFTNHSQTAGFSLTRIDHCLGVEGVTQGVTPQGVSGFDAISTSMLAGCIRRH